MRIFDLQGKCAVVIGGTSGIGQAIACGLAGARLLNLGWAGSCLLSGLAARIIRDQPADGIVLKLGINVWSEGQLKERTFSTRPTR